MEEVGIEAQVLVGALEEDTLNLRLKMVIANQAVDDRPVFPLAPPARAGVLDNGLIVFLVKA